MAQAKNGDKVKVHYTGSLEDGTVFDTSLEREPLEFVLGQGMVIAGFEEAVTGMNPGDTKSINLPPDQAYGEYNPEAVTSVPRTQIPPNIEPEVGMMLEVRLESGQPAHVIITEVTDEAVTLDGNHPLAGKDLKFDLNLVEIC